MWCDYCEYNKRCSITNEWCNEFKYKQLEVKVAKLVYKVVTRCRDCPYATYDLDEVEGRFYCKNIHEFIDENDADGIHYRCKLQEY